MVKVWTDWTDTYCTKKSDTQTYGLIGGGEKLIKIFLLDSRYKADTDIDRHFLILHTGKIINS